MGATNKVRDARLTSMIDEALSEITDRFLRRYELMAERCQSPIEEMFLLAMMSGAEMWPYYPNWMAGEYNSENDVPILRAYAQAPIAKYRADFLIIQPDGKKLVIECDGHDFHERTKEQAKHDRSRDRWMTANGYTVMRFTGSEIYADAGRCADEVFNWLIQEEMWRA